MFPDTDYPKPVGSFPIPIPIPATPPDDGTQLCVQFSEDWQPYILGCLAQLGLNATWKTDDPAALRAVISQAQVLLDLFMTGVDCMAGFLLAACDDPDCGIKYSTDGGDTWTCVNLNGCIADAVGIGIDNAIQDGILQSGVQQQGPQSRPAPNICRTYHVHLAANDKWICPSPVSGGDTVLIENATGGWSDGELLSRWRCPDGLVYALGECGGETELQEADPAPTIPHLQLVGHFDDVWFDPLTQYAIPDGTAPTDLFVQSNDGDLADNYGSADFDITVCSAAGFVHVFDAASELSSWTPNYGFGVWSDGRWNSSGQYQAMYIHYNLPMIADGFYTRYQVTVHTANLQDADTRWYSLPDHAGTLMRDVNSTNLDFDANYAGGGSMFLTWGGLNHAFTISEIRVWGTGTDPF